MENGKPLSYQFNGGYCSLKDNVTFYFYNQDHLGNNRTVINSTTGKAEQTINYYPFGTPYCDSTSVNPGFQKFKYNGKELDMMHGLNTYDYGARQYYSVVPAWDRIDALCEKYYSISPYVYCGNDPVNLIDPDGQKIEFAKGTTAEFKNNFNIAVEYLKTHGCGDLYEQLVSSPTVYYIKESTNINDGNYFSPNDVTNNNLNTLSWNPYRGIRTSTGTCEELSPCTLLNHEFDHMVLYDNNPNDFYNKSKPYSDDAADEDKNYGMPIEKIAITGTEQKTAQALGEIGPNGITRTEHLDGTPYQTIGPTSNVSAEKEVIIIGSKKKEM